MKRFLDRIKPGRKIDANSAVLLPFTRDGKPDHDEFQRHLLRTSQAGITPRSTWTRASAPSSRRRSASRS